VGVVIRQSGDGRVPDYIEPVRGTRKHMKLGRHTSLEQPLGIDDVLVPESVQCSHADVGGWEIRQVGGAGGGG
jgi:hypothetical protein